MADNNSDEIVALMDDWMRRHGLLASLQTG
jgi:hypothetical protein